MSHNNNPILSNLRLVLNPCEIDFPIVSQLLTSVGMRKRRSVDLKRAILASSDVVIAYLEEELVGFGRMISDQTYYGSIWDVAVRPDLQGQGIGAKIIERLLMCAKKRKLYMVGLFTACYNRNFYEQRGFEFLDDVHAMRNDLKHEKPAIATIHRQHERQQQRGIKS